MWRKLQQLQWNGCKSSYSETAAMYDRVHISFAHSIWPVVRDGRETSVYKTSQIMPGKETSVYKTYQIMPISWLGSFEGLIMRPTMAPHYCPSDWPHQTRRMHHPANIWSDCRSFTMHRSNQQSIIQMRRQSNNHLRCLRFTLRQFSEWTLRYVHIISHKHKQHESPSGEPCLKNMWYRLQSLGIQFAKQTTIFA